MTATEIAQTAEEQIKTLEKLFPGPYFSGDGGTTPRAQGAIQAGDLLYNGLNVSFGQSGKFAFAGPISWRERAKRILTLIKRLREDGDVYVVSRRSMRPDMWFRVEVQKEKEAPKPAGGPYVTVRTKDGRFFRVALASGMHGKLPALIRYNNEIYALDTGEIATGLADSYGVYGPATVVQATLFAAVSQTIPREARED